jgi:hypothetical protein
MEPVSHVIILIHGIRDFARWRDRVRAALETQFTVEATIYGWFDLLRFLLPINYFREQAIDRAWNQLLDVRKLYPQAHFSFVAHSFGTHILAHILRREFAFPAHRIIFCGSVLRYTFAFEQISDRCSPPILNEVGARDPWPAIAESVTWGYGSAGTYGFLRTGVRDRWHAGAKHGFFLSRQFCNRYWIPFLKDGVIVYPNVTPEDPALLVRILSRIQLKYLFIFIIILLILIVSYSTRMHEALAALIGTKGM